MYDRQKAAKEVLHNELRKRRGITKPLQARSLIHAGSLISSTNRFDGTADRLIGTAMPTNAYAEEQRSESRCFGSSSFFP